MKFNQLVSVYCEISPLYVLYSGSTPYSYLKQRLYLTGDGSNITDSTVFDGYLPYDEFAFLRRDVYREVNLPITGNTLGIFTPNIVKSGSTAHTTITPILAPYQNWNLYLSYVCYYCLRK